MKKFVHPASRKPEREAWAKKGIPVDWKPESVSLCPIGSPCDQTSVIRYQAQTVPINPVSFGQATKWWDAWRHKGDSRVGTQWDYSHSCFVSFFQIVNSMLFGGVLLLGCQPLVQKKTPIHRQSLNQYKFTCPYKLPLFSFVLFCLAKNVQCSFLIYAFDIKLLIHKYLHMKQEIDYRWHQIGRASCRERV